MANVRSVVGVRVESVDLKTCHSVDFLREEVSVGCKSEGAWAASDLPNVVVAVLHSRAIAVATGRTTDVVCVVAAADNGVHKAINEHVVDDG